MPEKKFPDWLREQVRGIVREVEQKPAPVKAKPAARPPARKAVAKPSARPGLRVAVADVPEPQHGPMWFPPPAPPKTDAHHVDGPCPCRVCGARVDTPGTYWGPWRQHERCVRLVGVNADRVVAAAAALGVGAVDHADAMLVPFRVPTFADTHPEPTWTTEPMRVRLPWRHVDRKGLARALAGLPDLRVEAGLDPSECTTGPCAWCGVTEALEWVDAGMTWGNGDPAPLCGGCYRVFVRHSEPSFPEEVRLALAELVTGIPVSIGETPPTGLVPFAETVSSDHLAGPPGEVTNVPFGTPWAHLNAEALRSYRFTVWARFGLRDCPPEQRDQVAAWAEDREAARAAARAEKQAEEAARTNVHGF